jgi:hypothetical protein
VNPPQNVDNIVDDSADSSDLDESEDSDYKSEDESESESNDKSSSESDDDSSDYNGDLGANDNPGPTQDDAGSNGNENENENENDNDDNNGDDESEPPPRTPDQHAINRQIADKYGARNAAYNLRLRRPRDFGHLHTMLESVMLLQYNMKKGIKLFGKDGVDAVMSELSQLDERKVLEPKDARDLSRDEKRAALEYLMFLKKKRCGRIKGCGCADGRKQWSYINKEDASSPTVSIEALLLSCVIDAME